MAPSSQASSSQLAVMGRALAVGSNTSSALRGRGVIISTQLSTSVTLSRRDGTPHVIRDITPLKLDLMRRYITHCQCITVSQSHHYPKCPHDIMVTVSTKCGVSVFPNTTKWIIDWCWLLVLAHNDHICVTPLSPRHQPTNGHIYTATYCITCTG